MAGECTDPRNCNEKAKMKDSQEIKTIYRFGNSDTSFSQQLKKSEMNIKMSKERTVFISRNVFSWLTTVWKLQMENSQILIKGSKSFAYNVTGIRYWSVSLLNGILIIVGYLMPNPLYTYILNIYDLVWFGLILWHINHCWLFNAKSWLWIYMICKYIVHR